MAVMDITLNKGRQEPIVAEILINLADAAVAVAGVAAAETDVIKLPVGAIVLDADIRMETTGTGAATGGTAMAVSALTATVKLASATLISAFDLKSAAGVGASSSTTVLPAALTVADAISFTPALGADGTAGLDSVTGAVRLTVTYIIADRADEVQP